MGGSGDEDAGNCRGHSGRNGNELQLETTVNDVQLFLK